MLLLILQMKKNSFISPLLAVLLKNIILEIFKYSQLTSEEQ